MALKQYEDVGDLKLLDKMEIVLDLQKEQTEFYKIQFEKLLPIANDLHKKKQKIREKYDLTNTSAFNIFSLFSEKYYLEGFHDEALLALLDPNTPTIGNKVFLEKFLEAIGVSVEDFGSLDDVQVKAQESKIDILIHNNKNAVIIENKLNNAEDQHNQLARYYKYVKEERQFNVLKIVYLPLNATKEPDLKVYSDKLAGMTKKRCKEIVNEIVEKNKNEKYIVIMPAVVSKYEKSKKDITHDWLEKIDWDAVHYHSDDDKNLAKMFAGQYKNLLLSLGGKELMKKAEEEMFKAIFSSKEKLQAAIDFVDTWNNNYPNLFTEYILEQDGEYKEKEDDFRGKKIGTYKLWFYYDFASQICFCYDIEHTKTKKKEIVDLLSKSNAFDKHHARQVNCNTDNKEDVWGDKQTYRYMVYDVGEKTLPELKKIVWETLQKLEKELIELNGKNKK